MENEILQKLLIYLENTKDFILAECPDIFQQIIRYEKICAIIGLCVIGSLVLIGSIYFLYAFFNSKGEIMNKCPFIILPIFLIPALLLCSLECINTLIKLNVAPKYFLIEKLIKKNK